MLKVDGFRVTSRHVPSAYPWQCQPGLPAAGPVIGYDSLAEGSLFCYDPFELYQRGVLSSPNMIVLGQLGKGKSALVKSYLMRQAGFGRAPYVLDPKGEYGAFAQVLGIPHLALKPGGRHRLNPLDCGRWQGQPEDMVRSRTEMLAALASAGLERSLGPSEHAAVGAALRDLPGQPTLGMVVERLLGPTASMGSLLRVATTRLAEEVRDVALVLHRLLAGDLAGMFDGQTNVPIERSGSGMVVDLSSVFNTPAMGPVMVCTAAWLSTATSVGDGRKRIVVVDEAWATLGRVSTTRWLQAQLKLARQFGLQFVIVTHRLSDLVSQSDEGTEAARQAAGLLSDTETRVLYGQPASERDRVVDLLGLSNVEADLVVALPRYRALWLVGRQAALVDHLLTSREAGIVDTNAAMREVAP